ncbi:MAG: response regulator [Proteobacteria bacterium]|nr:response regulator [Pseudomonadota bacterium]
MSLQRKLLLVEDNPGDSLLIEEMLARNTSASYAVKTVSRLSDAVHVLQQSFDDTDVVLLDLNLPDSNGIETVYSIRKKAPYLAIVVLTGDQDEKTGIAAVQAGAQDFLVKGQIPIHLICRVIDYAIERQQKNKALSDTKNFLRATLDALSSHIAIIDKRGNLLAVNRAWKQFARQNEIDPLRVSEGANYFDVCENAIEENVKEAIDFMEGARDVFSGKKPDFRLEYPCHSPEEKRWFYCTITPFVQSGSPCVVISHENITKRKLAEQAVRDSEIKMRMILDALTKQVLFLDLDYHIIWGNQEACRFAQSSRDELIGKRCFNLWPDQDKPCEECAIRIAVQQGKPATETRTTSDGKTWEVMGCPVRNQKGDVISVVEIREDITEHVAVEEQFRQAQKMEAIGQLAGGVAHDFNNMLTVITGFSELTRDQLCEDSPIAGNIDEILLAAKKSSDLVRHLLAFARKQTITPSVVNCNDIIQSSEKMLKRLVGEDIVIQFFPATDLWPVKIDPSQIDQIVTNLAVNARDAISGVGQIIIETKNTMLDDVYCKPHIHATPGSYVMITFSDNGSGMDQEIQSRIFEPFYTTKKQGEGTGLGLSTIFGILKQNKGMINVYSEPGKGTTFKIYLPRYHGGEDGVKTSRTDDYFTGTETILVVEDELKILKLCKEILESAGYAFIGFSSPEEAVHYVAQADHPIHLLISDVVMPGMNGEELRQAIEKLRPDIKTVFMSGYPYNVVTNRGVLPLGTNFIQKPFSKLAFNTKVRDALEK